jgi:putative acetyltransferase
MLIRPERATDVEQIRAVNLAAFDTRAEADLVDVLRQQADPVLSLVADEGGDIVGHIMFSPATLTKHPDRRIMGLAPVAVLPRRQRHGVGTALIREGLARCRALGFGAVIVLGHARYYPRFGFAPASRWGIHSEYDVPDDVFMALELTDGSLVGSAGLVKYHAAFANL